MAFNGPTDYVAEAAAALGISDPQVIGQASRIRPLQLAADLISQIHDRDPESRAGTLPYIEAHLQTIELALAASKAMVADQLPELDPDPPAAKARKPKKPPAAVAAVQPVAQPAVQPVAQPAVQPVAQPVAQPESQSVTSS